MDIPDTIFESVSELPFGQFEVTNRRDPGSAAELFRVSKRADGEKIVTELEITDEYRASHDDEEMLEHKLSLILESFEEAIWNDYGREYQYDGRSIRVCSKFEVIAAHCDRCMETFEYIQRPHRMVERGSTGVEVLSLDPWIVGSLEMAAVENVDRNCSCSDKRSRTETKRFLTE